MSYDYDLDNDYFNDDEAAWQELQDWEAEYQLQREYEQRAER